MWMTAAATLCAAVLAVLAAREEVFGYRLVVADPDTLPRDAKLTAYGAARGATLYRRYCQE